MKYARRTLLYAALIAFAMALLLPFAWLVRCSLCDARTVLQPIQGSADWLPKTMHPENYAEVFRTTRFLRYLANSLIVSVSVIVGTVLSSSLCAYAFAFCRARYRHMVFYGVLGTMMLPGVVTLIPVFILFRQLEWVDTLKPLIVPAWFGNAFAIFLFRQFFLGLPRELIEAAWIDGASSLQIYARIIMPLSVPASITVAISTFMGTWNDFMGPMIFLHSQENWTLQLGLQSFMGQVGGQWHLLMAATVMVAAPAVALFFLLQRYIIAGLAMTGVKG